MIIHTTPSPFLRAGIALAIMLGTVQCDAALISEYQPNPGGVNSLTLFGELSGEANAPFAGVLLAIGGESGRRGRIDNVATITGTFDARGILEFEYDVFLDPTITVALVDEFRGQAEVTDIDLDDDGVADNIGDLIGIRDAIGIADSLDDQQFLYGSDLLPSGQDFAFTGDEPRLIFRDASIGSWYAINNPDLGQILDITGNDIAGGLSFSGDPFATSFGSVNPGVTAVPEPGTFIAMGFLAAGGALRRRVSRVRRARS